MTPESNTVGCGMIDDASVDFRRQTGDNRPADEFFRLVVEASPNAIVLADAGGAQTTGQRGLGGRDAAGQRPFVMGYCPTRRIHNYPGIHRVSKGVKLWPKHHKDDICIAIPSKPSIMRSMDTDFGKSLGRSGFAFARSARSRHLGAVNSTTPVPGRQPPPWTTIT